MRIAFTGTHRVGKTSLATAIANSLPQYELMAEPYVQLEENGYLFSEIPTPDDYQAQFDFAINQIKRNGDFLFDRCPLDLLAYIHATDKARDLSVLYEEMIAALSQIDLLVFVPIESPDLIAYSTTDLPNLRRKVNDTLEDWINELNIPILLVNGTLENRKKQVLDDMIRLQN